MQLKQIFRYYKLKKKIYSSLVISKKQVNVYEIFYI